MKVDCKRIKMLLVSYLEEKISEEERECVSKHIEKCNDCSQELETLKEQIDGLKSLPKIKASKDLLKNINNRIDKELEEKERRTGLFRLRLTPQFALACVFLLFVGITVSNKYRFSKQYIDKNGNTKKHFGLFSKKDNLTPEIPIESLKYAPQNLKNILQNVSATVISENLQDNNLYSINIKIPKANYDIILNQITNIYPNSQTEIIKKDNQNMSLKIEINGEMLTN